MFYQRSGIGYDQPPSYQVVSDFGVVGEDDESGKEDDCCFDEGVYEDFDEVHWHS